MIIFPIVPLQASKYNSLLFPWSIHPYMHIVGSIIHNSISIAKTAVDYSLFPSMPTFISQNILFPSYASLPKNQLVPAFLQNAVIDKLVPTFKKINIFHQSLKIFIGSHLNSLLRSFFFYLPVPLTICYINKCQICFQFFLSLARLSRSFRIFCDPKLFKILENSECEEKQRKKK